MDLSSAPAILAVVALILAVAGIVKPQWPCTAVAVILLSVAVLIGHK